MLSSAEIEANKASWHGVVEFIDSLPEWESTSTWRAWIVSLLAHCIEEGLDQYFQAGISVVNIIFSTVRGGGFEGLDPQPPRVTLSFDMELGPFLAWSSTNTWFQKPDEAIYGSNREWPRLLKKYLRRLWIETRPDEPMPEALLDKVEP